MAPSQHGNENPLSTIPFRMVGLSVAEATTGRRFKELE
jgi:hypothetical protein